MMNSMYVNLAGVLSTLIHKAEGTAIAMFTDPALYYFSSDKKLYSTLNMHKDLIFQNTSYIHSIKGLAH